MVIGVFISSAFGSSFPWVSDVRFYSNYPFRFGHLTEKKGLSSSSQGQISGMVRKKTISDHFLRGVNAIKSAAWFYIIIMACSTLHALNV